MSGEEKPEARLRGFSWSLEELLSGKEIWLCASCFRCVDRCPRDVGFTNLSIAIRNLAAREGNIPDALRAVGSAIMQVGLAYKIPASRLKMREKYGLPPLPPTNADQVKALLEGVGFGELIARKKG